MALFFLVWAWSGIQPAIPEDWLLENLLVFFLDSATGHFLSMASVVGFVLSIS
jgi:hypothetical protein